MVPVSWLLVSGLLGCKPGDGAGDAPKPPIGSVDPSDPSATSVPDPTGNTEPPVVVDRCTFEQDVSAGNLSSAWRSPTGTLFAVGASPQARVRAADGAWTLDPPNAGLAWALQVHGSADDEVWALGDDAVFERQADGTWLDMGAGILAGEAQSIHVFGPDDVLVLSVEHQTCVDCTPDERPSLVTWDGVAWSAQSLPSVDAQVSGSAVLPDRTAVLAVGGGLLHVGVAPIPTPPELYLRSVVAADDGTLVAVGDGVAIGDASGLTANTPPSYVTEWTHAWAASATDVWVAGAWWQLGTPWAVVAHWDGVGWTEITDGDPAGLVTLAGGGGEVFAVGGYDHEVVLRGDGSGLAIDRETFAVGEVRAFARDDGTGEVWAAGFGPVLGRFVDGAWTGVPLPDRDARADVVAASDGRVLMSSAERLYVFDDGALATTEVEGWYRAPVAAAGGALFAASLPLGGDAPGVTQVWRDAGAGWEVLDTTGLPSGALPVSAWADGPDALWLGIDTANGGALAQWDGASWTLPVRGLSDAPGWVGRGADGVLYYTQFRGDAVGQQTLWTWDGATAAPVPYLVPDIQSVQVMADGTLVASAVARSATGDRETYSRVSARAPGEAWAELFSSDYVVPMVGSDDTVWSSSQASIWWWAPCATR